MIPSLRLLQKSTALRAAVGFGLGGVGFALGNLLLARALPPAAFGVFTLFLALVQMGASLAPIGLQGQVNRHPTLAVSPARLLLTSAIVGAALASVAAVVYRLEAALVALRPAVLEAETAAAPLSDTPVCTGATPLTRNRHARP